ncbi:MAG: MATE family efflux transporter [Clostridia bacterium]
MTKDLTKGNVPKTLLAFALPMLIGNIFQQVYNIADTIIVGKKIGEEALAAVGVSFPIVFLLIAISLGIGIGCSIIISQLFGAKKMKDVKTASYTALIASLVVGTIFTAIGIAISMPILQMLKTPDNIIKMAEEYLVIIFAGSIFVFVYNVTTSIFNALGNSKTPLVFLILSAVLNIVLDLYFIVDLKMGIGGAAFATIISQAIAAACSLIYLIKKLRTITSEKADKIFDVTLLKTMAKIALPSMLQQSLVSVGMMAVQGVVNSFGSNVVAGFTAACKLDSIAMMPIINVSNALATFTAQNMGAKKVPRVKEGLRASIISCCIFSVIIAVIMYAFGENFINAFLDENSNTEIVLFGAKYLKSISVFYILMAFMFCSSAVLRGSGTMKAFMLSTVLSIVIRIVSAYALAPVIGSSSIWVCIIIGWGAGAIISLYAYLKGNWQNTKTCVTEEEINEITLEELDSSNTINVTYDDYV